jgi:hypothetical protein
MNDMTTPKLVKTVKTPKQPDKPMFIVQKYLGGGFALGTDEGLAAGCQVTICNVLNDYEVWSQKPLMSWPGTSNLYVRPLAGVDLNAYYDRRSLCFFYAAHKSFGMVHTAASTDIVAHELGHALLDAYRPRTWGAPLLEVWSFHEAFADFTSILNIMGHEEILKHALRQTEGDMRKPNVISNLAEHVGRAIFKIVGPKSGRRRACLRSAVNDFNYVPPKSLPKDAPFNQLAAEPHSFGRVMLGALYDILLGIYEHTVDRGESPLKSLQHARHATAKRFLQATLHAPINGKFYESFAKTMLWADKTKFNNTYQSIIRDAFLKRNIITEEVKILSNAPACDNEEGIVKVQSTMQLKLSDHLVRAQSNNPLYNVELEIPQEQVYLYDHGKNLVDSVVATQQESLDAAQDMIIYLHESGQVGEGPDTPFEIRDNKLVRTHFS